MDDLHCDVLIFLGGVGEALLVLPTLKRELSLVGAPVILKVLFSDLRAIDIRN